jgi:hypothetical protein
LRVQGGLSEAQAEWIKTHEQALLVELGAQEAAAERAAIHEYDAGMDRAMADAVAELYKDYLRHLMGIGKQEQCCHAPTGRFCADGRYFRDRYVEACEQRDRADAPG